MLVDRYDQEDVFARVPELAEQTDPVLVELDRLLEDDALYQQVRADLAWRYRLTPVHGRHATPGDVLLRLLVVKHLYTRSYAETVQGVADSLARRYDTAALGTVHPPDDAAGPHRPGGEACPTGQCHPRAQAARRSHRGRDPHPLFHQ